MACTATMEGQQGHVHVCMDRQDDGDHLCACGYFFWSVELGDCDGEPVTGQHVLE